MTMAKRLEKLEKRIGGDERRIVYVMRNGDRKWTEAEDEEMLAKLPDRPGLYGVRWNGEKFTEWRDMDGPLGFTEFEEVNREYGETPFKA